MTIRIGPDPALRQSYIGDQSASAARNYAGSGSLSFKTVVQGVGGARRTLGSGALSIGAPQIELIPVQIVRRRGPGDVMLPKPLVAGASTRTAKPFGAGETPLRIVASGTAIRRIGANAQFDINGNVSMRTVVAGDAFISQRYISGTGDLSLGNPVVKDVDNPVLPHVVQIEGVFEDRTLEGLFREQIDLEGVG